jgi:hypothetical protein
MTSTVGKAAEVTVHDGQRQIGFRKWREFDRFALREAAE